LLSEDYCYGSCRWRSNNYWRSNMS